jgi:hypothetical protein
LPHLAALLVCYVIVQPNALHNRVLLFLANVELAGHVFVCIRCEEVVFAGELLLASDRLINPLGRVDLPQVIVTQAGFHNIRLYLEGKTLLLVHNLASVLNDFVMEFLVGAALRNVEV